MTRNFLLGLLLGLLLFVAAGCEQTSIVEEEQIRTLATLQAATPSATPAPTGTPPPTSTPGPSPTPTITPIPTNTPAPSPTPLPPTPTPNPALAGFSLCAQSAGDAEGGRFSARVAAITTTVEPAFERVIIGLDVPDDSAPPHATARCVSAALDQAQSAAAYTLRVDLGGWLHDDAFRASVVSPTLALSGTTVITRMTYRFDQAAAAGATLTIDLAQPLPFRLAIEKNPYRLVLDVAKASPLGPASDPLLAAAPGDVRADDLYYLQGGDIWLYTGGKATNITNSPEIETALAASSSTRFVAFCRLAPGADLGDALASGSLWTMESDGSDPVQLAAVGRSCSDPVISPDGRMIAFSVDESGATPARLSIWTAPISGGTPERITAPGDEWSRFAPQWIGDDRLVYLGAAEDGRQTLFLRTADGAEQDIGAKLLVSDAGVSRYRGFGRPSVAPSGNVIAIEALRADAPGADLVMLDGNGAEQRQRADSSGIYWARPLAWGADDSLFYLTSACPSEAVHNYAVRQRAPSGDDRIIAAGITTGAFGAFRASGAGLAYVTLNHAAVGSRGPLAIDPLSASTLWFWDLQSGVRAKLAEAQGAITDIAP